MKKKIGTWLDGKPLYQKTIQDTMPIITTDGGRVGKGINISSLNIDTCVSIAGFVNGSDASAPYNEYCPINHFQNFDYKYYVFCCVEAVGGLAINQLWIAATRPKFSEMPVLVTLQYTKVGDII